MSAPVPFPAVLISARTGDIFRVWPNGLAFELTEVLFRSADDLEAIEPGHFSTLAFHSDTQGDEWWLCPKVSCSDCDGRGWISCDPPHDRKRDESHGHHETACEGCNGAGSVYVLAPKDAATIHRNELPRLAQRRAA